ncbi:transcriptional regulator [Halobiforma lacisalsi AJ5]|uniref:Transcriptional regulator n=1 Tax=Natronobacterium lacisalsi AJ5 TaxID=358396 RepID=M0LK99_NATLA|nr:helix-turn-helix domain-containing protein [Halobiforma lacisalsi]APW97193.1 transcriptional regulator [Halobiforma lacisalsi AJ5]EMA34027.1 hypothetical protein C445_08417 [Halobiforma lacisalsi AJ5]
MSFRDVFSAVSEHGPVASELEDVFELLAHELRLEILQRLWEAESDTLAFSDLFKQVDTRDSGKFSYHLDRLTPAFVRTADSGYALTFAGRDVIGAVLSGRYTAADRLEAETIEAGSCLFCDEAVTIRYEDGHCILECEACGSFIFRLPVPPVVLASHEAPAVPRAINDHLRLRVQALNRGLCKLCRGRVEAMLTAASAREPVAHNPDLDVTFECRECGDVTHLNAGIVLIGHPVVVATLFDVGLDPRTTYIWELTPLLDPDAALLEEPPRLELGFEFEEERLELVVDDRCNVVDYARR